MNEDKQYTITEYDFIYYMYTIKYLFIYTCRIKTAIYYTQELEVCLL